MGLLDRLRNAWNAFIDGGDPYITGRRLSTNFGAMYSSRPDRVILNHGTERSIVSSIYNRIALDCSALQIKHVRLDEQGRYLEDINSSLNNCLTLEANKDQTGRMLIQDIVMSLFDEGCIAVVPIDTSTNPYITDSYDILTMRVARIVSWYPDYIEVEVYNDRTGQKQNIMVPKKSVAIIENPLYAIMNEPNSTLKRLVHKLNLLDIIDDQAGSQKLNLIVQLPYTIHTDARRKEAEQRRADIEDQLVNSKYGIAYTDGTEHITQLNRPIENDLLSQIKYLTETLYSQLGITDAVLNGTADEKTMLNYQNRTIRPIMDAIVDEFKRKFLTKTARSQHQSIMYFNEPFKLVPISSLADIADKFTRNEIMSSNEVRQIAGLKPVQDSGADELRNKNLNRTDGQSFPTVNGQSENSEATSEGNGEPESDEVGQKISADTLVKDLNYDG